MCIAHNSSSACEIHLTQIDPQVQVIIQVNLIFISPNWNLICKKHTILIDLLHVCQDTWEPRRLLAYTHYYYTIFQNAEYVSGMYNGQMLPDMLYTFKYGQ